MSNLYKFRRYKRKQGKKNVEHPKLIVDEFENEFDFMWLTSSKRKGKRHKNLFLKYNPQFINGQRLNKKSYLRRKIEYDKKSMFGKVLDNYSLSDEDLIIVMQYVKTKLKKIKKSTYYCDDVQYEASTTVDKLTLKLA